MAHDDRNLPRAFLRGESMYIEGETDPYFRDPEKTISIALNAAELINQRGYTCVHMAENAQPPEPSEALRGRGALDRDKFAVAGLKTDPQAPINVTLRSGGRWGARIDFVPYSREVSDEEQFCVEVNMPPAAFSDLLGVLRRGRADTIVISMKTTMWTRDKWAVYSGATFHLAPRIHEQSTFPETEFGTITDLLWTERHGEKPFPPQVVVEPDGRQEYAEPPYAQMIELLRRLYSLLGILVLTGVFIAVLLLVRR